MPKIEAELKQSILSLPLVEKEKLLLKLISKDTLLIDQLYFQLIENSDSAEWRRENLEKEILDVTHKKMKYFDDLNKISKEIYAKIQWHQKVTKDKYGELFLILTLLKQLLTINASSFTFHFPYNRQICNFVFQKTKVCLRLISKIDAEYWLDFEESINFVLKEIKNNDVQYANQQNILPYKFEF